MGNLLNHSYEGLQVELGLPGEIFQYPYLEWGQIVTHIARLSHTWQYFSEFGLQLNTHKMAFQGACDQDSFLMLNFWKAGY